MSSTISKEMIRPIIMDAQSIGNQLPESFPDPSTGGNVSWKTLISSPNTPTNTFTVGIATCPSGSSASCPNSVPGHLKLHRHAHAEIYHVISGRGIVTIDGEEHQVSKGTVVFIPGDAEHGIRCVGREGMSWLYVFAADGFGEVVYRFDEPGTGKKAERDRMREKPKL